MIRKNGKMNVDVTRKNGKMIVDVTRKSGRKKNGTVNSTVMAETEQS